MSNLVEVWYHGAMTIALTRWDGVGIGERGGGASHMGRVADVLRLGGSTRRLRGYTSPF